MALKNEKRIALLLLLIMAAFALWGHFNLPDGPVAVHFNAMHGGVADGFRPRDQAVWIMPGVSALLLVLLFWILPAIMPKSGNIERSFGVYGVVVVSTFCMLCLTQAMLVLSAAGMVMDHIKVTLTAIGVLFIVLGNFLPKMRKNWVMGIRTPWTLSDERVWDKTHRFAGPLFILGGFAVMADALFAPQDWRVTLMLVAILVPSFVSVVYSYLAARRLNLV